MTRRLLIAGVGNLFLGDDAFGCEVTRRLKRSHPRPGAGIELRDFGDATEIDEMLSLRIQTLSADEKGEARETDPWVRALLDRVDALNEQQLSRLHGARRDLRGARVKLSPRRSADGFDLLLAGRTGVVCAVECNVDGDVLLGVTLDDDPGRDLGAQGMPGHRFFFGLDEVTLLDDRVRG